MIERKRERETGCRLLIKKRSSNWHTAVPVLPLDVCVCVSSVLIVFVCVCVHYI